MRTSASIGGHPIHLMLVVFPFGLWIFSLVCDLIGLSVATSAVRHTVALYAMVGGLIGALAAAVPGFKELLYCKGGEPPVKKMALAHMAINLTVVVLYGVNIWLRTSDPESLKISIIFLAIGVCMISVSGWLGGQMVPVHGVEIKKYE